MDSTTIIRHITAASRMNDAEKTAANIQQQALMFLGPVVWGENAIMPLYEWVRGLITFTEITRTLLDFGYAVTNGAALAELELVEAGWVQKEAGMWDDPQTGRRETYERAILISTERERDGRPALVGESWRALRQIVLELVLEEYGRLALEHIAGVTAGLSVLALPSDISDADLIDAIIDAEVMQREGAAA